MEIDKVQAEKLLTLGEDPSLALFQEIQEIGQTLKTIAEKETPDFPTFPEIPEQKETDMSETNSLLQQLLDKEGTEPIDISVTLKIV